MRRTELVDLAHADRVRSSQPDRDILGDGDDVAVRDPDAFRGRDARAEQSRLRIRRPARAPGVRDATAFVSIGSVVSFYFHTCAEGNRADLRGVLESFAVSPRA